MIFARPSSPLSFAMVARVRRFGRYGRYRSSTATWVSAFSICAMVFFSLVAAFFALLSIVAFFNSDVVNGCKMAFVSITYVFIVFLEYAVGKNKDKNFTFNVISILLAFIPIVFAVIS